MIKHFIHTRPVTAPGVAQYICPVELRQGWREGGRVPARAPLRPLDAAPLSWSHSPHSVVPGLPYALS